MRTTLTLDDHLAERLQARRARTGQSLREVVDELLRAGLEAVEQSTAAPYRITPLQLGSPSVPLHGKLYDLLDHLDASTLLAADGDAPSR